MPSRTSNSCEKGTMKAKVFEPDLTGKVILITGGTSGIGAELIVHLSHLPHPPGRIIFTGRNATSANAVIERCRNGAAPSVPKGPELSFIPMDLSSLESVSAASTHILSLLRDDQNGHRSAGRLDVLLANAGIMAQPPGLSTDGYEIQFATNHLGHALLIRKLMPLMLETAAQFSSDVRIITTSSTGWRLGKMDDFPFEQLAKGDLFEGKTFFAKSLRYGNSKLANLVYAKELAARFGDDAVTSGAAAAGGNSNSGDAAAGVASAVDASGDNTNDATNNDIHVEPASQALRSISPKDTTLGDGCAKTGKGILSLSIHPGVVGTGLVNDLPWADRALIYASQMGKILTPEEGIRNHLWAISTPRGEIVPGAYYEPVGKLWSKSWSGQIDKKDPELGRKMWEWTEEQLQPWLRGYFRNGPSRLGGT